MNQSQSAIVENGASVAPQQAERASYAPLLIVAAVVGVFLLCNPAIIADWRVYSFDDGTYSHAYLIPFMSGYLLWDAWERRQLSMRFSRVFFALFLAALLLFQFLEIAFLRYPMRALLPAVPLLAVMALLRPTLAVWVSVGLLWFVTPVWGVINEALQAWSVWAVNHLMAFSSIPTYVYGNYVQIPEGTFEIADGCSGLRYVISAIALCLFYASLYLQRARSIVMLFAIALIGSMITNWLRITALILIGHYTDMQSGLIKDHNMFGWFLFVPFIAALFYFAGRIEPPAEQSAPAPKDGGTLPARGLSLVLAALVIVSGVTITFLQTGRLQWIAPIVDVERGKPQSESFDGVTPQFFVANEVRMNETVRGAYQLRSMALGFDGSTDAARAEFYLNKPVPDGWRSVEIDRDQNSAIALIERSNGERGLISYGYEIGGYRAISPMQIRIARLKAAAKLRRDSSLYWHFLPCDNTDCSAARVAMTDFLASSPNAARR